jgi:hypothetical protein
MTKKPDTEETLLTFPCDFTLKVFGLANDTFEATVLAIIHKHAPNLSGRQIKTRKSENGKYLALSVTIHVDSKLQLDNLYRELSASPYVLMAL